MHGNYLFRLDDVTGEGNFEERRPGPSFLELLFLLGTDLECVIDEDDEEEPTFGSTVIVNPHLAGLPSSKNKQKVGT